MRLRVLFALLVAAFFVVAAPAPGRAAEKTIGTTCNGDNSNIDWDTIGQCNGTHFQKGPLIVGAVAVPPYSSTACDTTKVGMIQYTSGGGFQGCNGTAWASFAGGGSGGGEYLLSSGAIVDFTNGSTQILAAPGGSTITLNNMQDGGSYTVIISDITPRTYTFNNCAHALYYPANAPTSGGSYQIKKTTQNGQSWCYINWISVSPPFPSNLVLTQAPNNRYFTISWTAGVGNGSCKLQYYTGSTWADITNAASLNCDGNYSNSYYLNGDGWKSNWGGTQVRVVRSSDNAVAGTFPTTLSCTPMAGSSTSTPNVDEDCNGYWDDYYYNSGQQVSGCPNGSACLDYYYYPSSSNCTGSGSYYGTQCSGSSSEIDACYDHGFGDSYQTYDSSGCTYYQGGGYFYH